MVVSSLVLTIDDLAKFNNDTFNLDFDFEYTGLPDNITSTKNTNGLLLFIDETPGFRDLLPRIRSKYDTRKLNSKDSFVHPGVFQGLVRDIMHHAKVKNHNFAKYLGKFSSRKQSYGFFVDAIRKFIPFDAAMELVTNVNRTMNNAFIMQFAGNSYCNGDQTSTPLMRTEYLHKYARNERGLIFIHNEPWCEGIWEDVSSLMMMKGAEISECTMPYSWFTIEDFAKEYSCYRFERKGDSTFINNTEYFRKGILLKTEERKFARSPVTRLLSLSDSPPKTIKGKHDLNRDDLERLFLNLKGKPINQRRFYSPEVKDISEFKDKRELEELVKSKEAAIVDYAVRSLVDSYGLVFSEGDILGAPYTYTIVKNARQRRMDLAKKIATVPINFVNILKDARRQATAAQQNAYLANIEAKRAKENERIAEKHAEESKRRADIITTYTRPSIIKAILAGKDPREFKPIKKELAIMFSDIRGFTTISETMDAMDITGILNSYFRRMEVDIEKNNGEIDKLIGDCIMALFENPIDSVKTAIEMRKSLYGHNRERIKYAKQHLKVEVKDGKEDYSKHKINTGIGITYSEIVMANLGGEMKKDLTVIGDGANLASRIESLTKYYKLEVLVSDSVKDEIDRVSNERNTNIFYVRPVDLVTVKGKADPVEMFEVYDHKPEFLIDFLKSNQKKYEEAIALYREGNFKDSIKLFRELLSIAPTHTYDSPEVCDSLIPLYIKRISSLIENPPKNWNGIYEHTTK